MNKRLLALALVLTMATLLGCRPDGIGTISGTVTDAYTGEPIEGVTVVFGSYSDATDAAGEYSIEVPISVTSVAGTFVAYKGLEYAFRACAGIAVDPTSDPVYDFDLVPNDPSGYSEVNLSGKIYDNTGTELGDSTDIWFLFANAGGGRSRGSASYNDPAPGYSVATKTTGSNCFMAVGTDFTFYQIGKNLSVDLTNHDLTQPPAIDYDSVTLNGTTGTMFFGNLLVSDSVSCVGYLRDVFVGPTTTLDVYNPQNYPLQWYVISGESDTPPRASRRSEPVSGQRHIPTRSPSRPPTPGRRRQGS